MLAIDKSKWESMSDCDKIEYLKVELELIKEIAEKHYKENAGTRPRLSGIEACTWITNEIKGLFEVIG